MSSYLVTGGAGFIGSHLVDYLINNNHKVVVLDLLTTGKKENINKKANFIYGCVTNQKLVTEVFEGIDFCYHLAAIPSVQDSISSWVECNKVNLGGTLNIFDIAAKNNIPVIYASSAAAYGASLKLPLKENNFSLPISPYGFDKYSNEIQAKLYKEFKGLKSVGLRFFNVYGPRQDPSSSYSGVINLFINSFLKRDAINVYGDGNQERDFIFVEDVIDALIKANNDKVLNDAEVFNVCTGFGTTINELIRVLFKILDKTTEINYLPQRTGEIYKSIGCPLKAEQLLQFIAQHKLEKGLKNTVSSFRF